MKDNGEDFGTERVELKRYKGVGIWEVVSEEDDREGFINTKDIYEARGSGLSVVNP